MPLYNETAVCGSLVLVVLVIVVVVVVIVVIVVPGTRVDPGSYRKKISLRPPLVASSQASPAAMVLFQRGVEAFYVEVLMPWFDSHRPL